MPDDVTPVDDAHSGPPAVPASGAPINPLVQLTETLQADFVWYSGPIDEDFVEEFLNYLEGAKSRPNLALILTTFGGSPDAAFRLCRCIKHHYGNFHLYVPGHCKSAGTLIAIGADEIIMLPRGELGPLDVQLAKSDDLFGSSSGLDISDALSFISTKSFALFEEQFTTIISRSGGTITTKTASEIATAITVGLMSPITQQLDPNKIGETQRAMNIAVEYGKLLGASPESLKKLIHGYPSHGFVIDYAEAVRARLFNAIREATDLEELFFAGMAEMIQDEFGSNLLREPSSSRLYTIFLNEPPQPNEDAPHEPNQQNGQSARPENDSSGPHHTGEASPPQPSDHTSRPTVPEFSSHGNEG